MPFGENKEHFQLLLADYMDQFQPQTGVETELVELLAVSRWRLRRLLIIETQRFDLELSALDPDLINNTDAERLAMVFKNMSDKGRSLSLLLRYEAQINRSYEKALKQLQQLQSTRPPAAPPAPSDDSVGSFGNPPAPASQTEPRPSGGVTSQPPTTASDTILTCANSC
jgi:hypothetical protein